MGGTGSSVGYQSPVPIGWLKALAAVLIIAKLALLVGSGTFMDEAYYWMWGQHPALSYYDHPPLNAWLQGLAGALFGWNRLSLRLMVGLALVADVALIWLLARRLAPDAAPALFWTSLVLFLSTPIFVVVTAVALPDHLMVTFGLAAIYCFHLYLADWRADAPSPPRWLYLAALALGLAVLSKYNAAFIGVGVALYIAIVPRLRPLLGRWQTYAAAALALAVQAPVLAWNVQNGFASFGFILSGRHEGLAQRTDGVIPFLISIVVFLSPFLLWPTFRFLLRPAARVAGDGMGRAIFAVSTLAILALSFVTTALFHWNLAAYLALLPFLALQLRSAWLLGGHVLYGLALLGGMIVNYAVVPVGDVERFRDEASAWVYGWDETAERVAQLRLEHGAGFIATPDYTTAALLGYAMNDRDVTSLSPRRDQFDFWFDAAAHQGQDAILLTDRYRPMQESVAAQFDSIETLESLEVVRFGKRLDTHQIHLARGFRGDR
jgi:4-amino-4-deoxy-L-arabinose transferase-like glycosyltransferase